MNMITLMLPLSLALNCTILVVLNFWLTQINPDSEKLSPMNAALTPSDPPASHSPSGSSSVAILFLLFDLEIALLLPLPWATQLPSPTSTLTWTSTIILLLTLGLIYEWLQGGLEWAE